MNYRTLIVEKTDRVATITFHNPSRLNALTPAFLKEYAALLDEIEQDDRLSVIILTGAGKAFIAGADISAMANMSPEDASRYANDTTQLYRKMEESKKVFIAAVNGYALGGGCELALACDLRVASSLARFGLPETGLGIFPGGGGTQRLPRLIGMARAKELVYTAKTIGAEEAERIGLVNRVTQPEVLLEDAHKLAASILTNSANAVGLSKEAFNTGAQMDLTSAIDLERNLFALCFAHPDQKEGMLAFSEKRRPNFD